MEEIYSLNRKVTYTYHGTYIRWQRAISFICLVNGEIERNREREADEQRGERGYMNERGERDKRTERGERVYE